MDDWRDGVIDVTLLDGGNGFVFRHPRALTLASIGDINGDGIDDFIVGMPAISGAADSTGGGYVVFGRAEGFEAMVDPTTFDGSDGFFVQGYKTQGFCGISVSAAGDVNGDGIDDFLISARDADEEGENLVGETYVVFGRTDGFDAVLDLSRLDGTNGFAIAGADAGDRSGSSVSAAGDVNGDGYDDILIGASQAGIVAAGAAYVLYGASDFPREFDLYDLNGENGFTIAGSRLSNLGSSVAGNFDLNGDGTADFIVGAPEARPGGLYHAGQAFVIFGRGSDFDAQFDLASLDGTNGFAIDGLAANDLLGFRVQNAGDFNGDGIDDCMILAANRGSESNPGVGQAFVMFGSRAGFDARFDLTQLNGANGFVIVCEDDVPNGGFSAQSAGDVNGDGYNDLIIGSAYTDGENGDQEGESYVVFGNSAGFNGRLDPANMAVAGGFRISGESIDGYSALGANVSAAGDVNDDGYADVVLTDNRGAAYVIYGHTSNNLQQTAGDDILRGANGNDTINGGGGHDMLFGGDGDDVMTGASGRDSMFGRGDDDRLSGGSGDDLLDGGNGNDVLDGRTDVDRLLGGDGNDTLIGGAHRDDLTGGRGADRFLFETGDFAGLGATSADRIFDFSQSQGDRIVLSAIDAIFGTAANDAFAFIGRAQFSNTAGELRFVTREGLTMIQGDTNGDGAADFAIRLDGLVDLAAVNFVL